MRQFITPLKERQRIAAYFRERYRTDEAYRLRKVNCLRSRQGLPPRTSVEEINPNGRHDAR
jgi:hypothetical protein